MGTSGLCKYYGGDKEENKQKEKKKTFLGPIHLTSGNTCFKTKPTAKFY